MMHQRWIRQFLCPPRPQKIPHDLIHVTLRTRLLGYDSHNLGFHIPIGVPYRCRIRYVIRRPIRHRQRYGHRYRDRRRRRRRQARRRRCLLPHPWSGTPRLSNHQFMDRTPTSCFTMVRASCAPWSTGDTSATDRREPIPPAGSDSREVSAAHTGSLSGTARLVTSPIHRSRGENIEHVVVVVAAVIIAVAVRRSSAQGGGDR